MAMTDPSPTLTPAKRVECEVVTHPDEPPKRLHQSLSEDVGSDSDIDALFESGVTRVVEVEEEESDGEVPDDLKNSEDYKKYLQLITESDRWLINSDDGESRLRRIAAALREEDRRRAELSSSPTVTTEYRSEGRESEVGNMGSSCAKDSSRAAVQRRNADEGGRADLNNG
ncbi:hypothetical protein SASPL_128956 [Salvia splendens]|uniref:Uncharacterized protein n=1 Tax=Salvia splendens TaxID=180675 RepID=A0A8X8XF52_SALSN|nr:hypothetical protein SASPL_128956 [Salvia splendens]